MSEYQIEVLIRCAQLSTIALSVMALFTIGIFILFVTQINRR